MPVHQSRPRRVVPKATRYKSAVFRINRTRPSDVSLERALREALTGPSAAASQLGVDVQCEILPAVGDALDGDVAKMTHLIARGVERALRDLLPTAIPSRREVWVRIARQHAGFEPLPVLLATVQACGADRPTELLQLEFAVDVADDTDVPSLDASVLIASPSPRFARIVHDINVRGGARVVTAIDTDSASAHVRATGEDPCDIVILDDTMDGGGALAEVISGLVTPPAVVLCARRLSLAAPAYVDVVVPKPVLPRELMRNLIALGRTSMPEAVPPSGTLRVLVADHDAVSARRSEVMLHALGCPTVHVRTGSDAIDHLARGSFSAALVAYDLPEVDGCEVACWLRNRERQEGASRTAVFLLSDSALSKDRAKQAGLDAIILKPLAANDLALALASTGADLRRKAG